MTHYADTSWWLAYKCRRDIHHPAAITLFDREPDARVVWTPWLIRRCLGSEHERMAAQSLLASRRQPL